MDWRIKSGIRQTLLTLPGGDRAYRWLTATLLGTNAGMAYKWFRVIPAHLRVVQQFYSQQARAQRFWCFDSGATMAAGLVIALVSDEPGLLTDRRGRLQNRYCAVSRQVMREKGEELAHLAAAPADRLTSLLQATDGLAAQQALSAIGISYAARHNIVLEAPWRRQLGCVFSTGTLEHYTPEELEEQIAGMAEALQPNGIMSHVVDHRDHRWHADKSMSPLAHLTLEDADYQRRFANPLDYHNRWLRSRYLELFIRYGFHVTCRDVYEYTADLPPLPRERLALPYRNVPEEELRHLVTHFMAVRR